MRTDGLKRFVSYAASYAIAVVVFDFAIDFLFPFRKSVQEIGALSVVLWSLAGGVSGFVRGRLAQIFSPVLLLVFLVGNLNSVASYYHYGNYYLVDLIETNRIFSCYALLFVVSVFFFDSKLGSVKVLPQEELRVERLNTVFFVFLVVFPILWVFDEVYTLRRIPLLSGQSIVQDMYSTEYGRLYGYGVLLAVCALVFMAKIRGSHGGLKLLYSAMIAFSLFAMVFDGRRVFLLIFLGAVLSFHLVSIRHYSLIKPLIKVSALILLAYIAILYQRQGGELITRFDSAQVFSKVGVEYRDFAYMVTNFKPGELEGYSWLGSSLGGFGNKIVLFLSGLNKGELVFSGSAYQIGLELKKGFGIRIGLFPEIWLEYGMMGLLFVPAVALMFIWMARMVERSTSEVGRSLAATTFGVALLSFVGQSSAITGYWSLLLYLFLMWRFFEQFRGGQSQPTPGKSVA